MMSKIDENKISLKVLFLIMSIIFSFINKFRYGGGISSIFIFIVGFTLSIFNNKSKFDLKIEHFLFLIFSIIICSSTMFSHITIVERDLMSFLIGVTYVILTTSIVYNKREIKVIFLSYIFSSTIGAINIIYNVVKKHQFVWNRYSTNFFGIDKDPNYASAFIVPAIILLLYSLTYGKEKKHRKLYCILLIIITIACILTGSRSAFIFVVFSYIFNGLIYIFSFKIKNIKNFLKIGVGIIIIIALWNKILYFLPQSLIIRLTTFSGYATNNGRLDLWEKVLEVFYRNPIIGIGLNGGNKYLEINGMLNSHNVYLDILTSSGIVGIIIFLNIIFSFLCVNRKSKIYVLGMIIVMLGPLFFINGFNTPSFWIPLILIGITKSFSNQTSIPIYEWI